MAAPEYGPIYGVELIGSLPIVGNMWQAMPSRSDLDIVRKYSLRTVAGYEVLLNAYRELLAEHQAGVPEEKPGS